MNKNGGVDLNAMGDEQAKRDAGLVKSGIQLPDLGKLAAEGRKAKIEERVVPMSQEEQCQDLIRTVYTRLAPSPVHGVGVFAIRDIKKGNRCFVMPASDNRPQWYKIYPATLKKEVGEVFPEIYGLILDRWPQVVNGIPFLNPNFDARLVSFMNHSDTPNYDPVTDLALTDIKAGEELFEDYRVVPNYEKAFPFLAEPVKEVVHTPKRRGKIK